MFTGVPARCVVLHVRCPGPPGSRSPVCLLRGLCCVCGVRGHLAPVHRCARWVCCVVRAVSWATWLLFTGMPARCVLLRVRCPGPLELSGQKESGLRYASKTNHSTGNYQLARHVLENGLAGLQVYLDEIQVELFASQQQHIMQLYCAKHLNNTFCFFWKAMGLAYANPPFSLLAKVLTKTAYEGGRVVMCTPDWGCSGEHAYWRRMLDRMNVGRVQVPDSAMYVPEESDTAMQAPEWASFLSVVN